MWCVFCLREKRREKALVGISIITCLLLMEEERERDYKTFGPTANRIERWQANLPPSVYLFFYLMSREPHLCLSLSLTRTHKTHQLSRTTEMVHLARGVVSIPRSRAKVCCARAAVGSSCIDIYVHVYPGVGGSKIGIGMDGVWVRSIRT